MSKTIYCGECDNFLYEDIDGYGFCGKKRQRGLLLRRQVSHNTWKAMTHYDFDLCSNEQCPKRFDCQRYLIYARGGWGYSYVMQGCIDFQHLKPVIK